MDQLEWIGINVCTAGNRPAQSKFELGSNWKTPTHATSLSSSLGLVGFYSQFIPNYDQLCQALQQLLRQYYQKSLPVGAWTVDHASCFEMLKTAILRNPCLARFDERLLVFFKTNWSKSGISCILMLPAVTTIRARRCEYWKRVVKTCSILWCMELDFGWFALDCVNAPIVSNIFTPSLAKWWSARSMGWQQSSLVHMGGPFLLDVWLQLTPQIVWIFWQYSCFTIVH